jgi:prolipoprotein diacylglyceryltransferase
VGTGISVREPFPALLVSRGGMSWFGGFAGGVLAAIGHAIGRVGCLQGSALGHRLS